MYTKSKHNDSSSDSHSFFYNPIIFISNFFTDLYFYSAFSTKCDSLVYFLYYIYNRYICKIEYIYSECAWYYDQICSKAANFNLNSRLALNERL